MKFNIQQTELNTALQHLVRNTENKFPVFSNIEIKSVDDKLELLASNGTITYKELVSANIEENTPIAIPAQKFYEIVSRLNNLICFNDGLITSGKNKIKIDVLNTLELPEMGFDCELIQIDTEEFKRALEGRLFAADKLTNNVISGIYIDNNSVVATNGNLMSIYEKDNFLPFEAKVLDSKFVAEFTKIFKNEKEVSIGFNNNKIKVETLNKKMIGMLKDGKYPPYKQLIPTPLYKVKLNKIEVLKSLEIIKLTIEDKMNLCCFYFEDNKLIISTKDGSSEIGIKYDDVSMKIWFNINYMSDCLKNISSDIVDFGFTEPLGACVIEAGNEKTLIMPVKNS